MHEHHLHVGGCEHRLADLKAFAGEKEHGHHHQRGMMMPAAPATDLVLPEPSLLFGVSKRALDEVTLSLHVRQPRR